MHTPKRNLSEFDMSGQSAPAEPAMNAAPQAGELPNGQVDREGAMAKADLYKLANYAHKLYEKIGEEDQLEAWVQAKITKAADYMASVYHYMEYEMKFSEYGHHLDNSDTLSESQKAVLKSRLMEAKSKVKELKKAQAEKVKEGAVEKDALDRESATEKKARLEREKAKPGVTKKSSTGGTTTSKDGKTVHKAGKFYETAEEKDPLTDKDGESATEEKARLAREKAKPGTTKKSSTGGTTTSKDGKTVHKSGKFYEGSVEDHHSDLVHAAAIVAGLKRRNNMAKTPKVAPGFDDSMDLEAEEGMGMDTPPLAPERQIDPAVKGKLEAYGKKTRAMAAAVNRLAKKDYDNDGTIESEKDEVHGSHLRAAGLAEASPSADLTKKEKSAVVKKAKKGGDIGKPGKNFDAVAKKAGGGEKGKKIAAAAMWKNIKETTAYMMEKEAATKTEKFAALAEPKDKVTYADKIAGAKKSNKKETVKESTDFTRMQEQLGRLNRSETHQLNESSEADQIRALTKRLNG